MASHRFLMWRGWGAFALLLLASICGVWCKAGADDLLDDKGIGGILDDINQEATGAWWNEAWLYRRKVTINDPKLLEPSGKAIFLLEPEPLLLYNTRRTAAALGDVRVIAADGHPIPSGVINFGRDDGTGRIWCLPNVRDGQKSLEFYLYYGNPRAPLEKHELPEQGGRDGDAQFVRTGPEEVRPEAQAPAAEAGSFFKNLIVAEAEKFAAIKDADEKRVQRVETGEDSGASGEAVMMPADTNGPLVLERTVRVPEAGAWQVHVRYKNPGKGQVFGAFGLQVGGRQLECGQEFEKGTGYTWQSLQADLPAGDIKLTLKMSSLCAPDVVVLTRDAHYQPDVRDINGPVWMRFKSTTASSPFYIDLFNFHVTVSVNGHQGKTTGFLFKDRNVLPKRDQWKTDNGGFIIKNELPPYLEKLPNDTANLIATGEWSPWGETLSHGSYTWYAQIRFIGGGRSKRVDPTNLDVAMEFATRPDITRSFRATSAKTGTASNFNIHMPPAVDLDTIRKDTLTFDEWARQRYAMTQSLGFKGGEGPKKIVMASSSHVRSEEEADYIMKTLDVLGLNTMTMMGVGYDVDTVMRGGPLSGVWTYYRTEYRFYDMNFFHLDYKNMVRTLTGKEEPTRTPKMPEAGETYEQAVERILAAATDRVHKKYSEDAKRDMPWQYEHMRFNDLDDEIGPAVDGRTINAHPLFHGLFVEYLKKQNLQPSHFGLKTWSELQAVDYTELSKNDKRLEQIDKDLTAAEKKLDEVTETPLLGGGLGGGLDDTVKENEKKQKERAAREKLGLPPEERPAPTAMEKRIYYWTQRFRSYYTAMQYRAQTAAVTKYYAPGIKASPNLQASPVQSGKMWDGALNVWDLGRDNAFSALQVEDWNRSPVNVSYGMNMMRAAARKNGQPTSALMVLRNPGTRIMANMSQGARFILFYLYGPVQGDPAFAEDRETQRQIGTVMRQVGRAEDDILAAKPRPAETAILVDNTSEINRAYFEYPFSRERMSIYAALNDAQIAVDLVGDREVLEDDALNRYKVLYVADPHVSLRTQQKIKTWVAAGGTLWADYAALARQEYDEPCTVMDEVFGLKTRGAVQPYEVKDWNSTLPTGVTVNVPKNELFAPDTISGARYSAVKEGGQPSYEVSTGKVLATFADGKPAIIRNKYGKGEALFCGFLAGMTYSGFWEPNGYDFSYVAREAPATPLRGQLVTALARERTAPQTKLDEHMFWTTVHDGPQQTVVFLINQGQDFKDKPLEVTLPKTPQSAYRGSGKPATYTMNGNRAVMPLSLAHDETDIVVFKY